MASGSQYRWRSIDEAMIDLDEMIRISKDGPPLRERTCFKVFGRGLPRPNLRDLRLPHLAQTIGEMHDLEEAKKVSNNTDDQNTGRIQKSVGKGRGYLGREITLQAGRQNPQCTISQELQKNRYNPDYNLESLEREFAKRSSCQK